MIEVYDGGEEVCYRDQSFLINKQSYIQTGKGSENFIKFLVKFSGMIRHLNNNVYESLANSHFGLF